jgi:hypothetical protein
MIISRPELSSQGGNLQYRVHVDVSGESKTLWYSLSEEFAGLVSDRSDAALAALLIPAMVLAEDIRIEGTVSEKLYFNLSGPYQKVLKLIIPSLHLITIIPSEVQPAHQAGDGVAAGFSAGIDSFCVLADHYFADVPKGFRITHLLFSNVGSHGPDDKESSRHLFHKRFNRIKPVTERIGLPFIAIDSNVDSFYNALNFQQTHTIRNASVALLLQKGIKRFLYASGAHYSDTCIRPASDMYRSDTIALPLLSTETLDMVSSGSQYTRVEKTLKVAGIEESYRFLDVCTADSRITNCSSCFKCKRTILTLEIAGALGRYSEVFDLDTYKKIRNLYIEEVLSGREDRPYSQELISFIRVTGFKIPFLSRFRARTRLLYITSQLRQTANMPLKIAGKIKRRYLKRH